jgi:creatinine amidohydrolase
VEPSVKLEELAWPEIAARLADGWDTVIVPTASTEQHGHHLPLNTDAVIAERVAELVAAKLGRTLVAPVIRPGLSSHHMAFPGSLTFTPQVFHLVIEATCVSLARHGFTTFILTSGHGGNFSYLDAAAPYLQDTLREKGFAAARIVPVANLRNYLETQQVFLAEHYGVTKEQAAFHADIIETACMLAIRPDLVDMSRAEPGWMGDTTQILDRLFTDGLRAITPVGVLGDPRGATREMGERLLDHLSDKLARDLLDRLGAASSRTE